MNANILNSLVAIFAAGLVTLACRATPFILFGSGRIPPFLDYLQRAMPPIVMTVLVFNSYKMLFPKGPSWNFAASPMDALALLLPGVIAALLQFWKRNALLSIVGATALHMIMTRLA
ncbi:MAG TPA: AzlD domain-containing protein [Rectinemataceae bacterium]|nr:AzlD domain-containing protein [Rectinemataceae bacterium]